MEGEEVLGSGEDVFRRVHRSYLRTDGSLMSGAFTPTGDDTDGISVYREAKMGGATPQQLLNSARKPANEYVIFRVQVAVFQSLGLSVTLTETEGGPPGHCVVPEYTFAASKDKAQKERWMEVRDALCNASELVLP